MEDLITKSKIILINMRDLVNQCEERRVTDEQWYIDFEIEMNKLTVRDHNRNNVK